MYSQETQELKQKYEDAKKLLGDLQDQRDEVEKRIVAIDADIYKRSHGAYRNPITEAAEKMLNGREDYDSDNYSPLADDRAELGRKRNILSEAIRIQRDVADRAKQAFSTSIGKDLRPEYQAKVKAIVAAVLALSKAVRAETEFRDKLTSDDIATGAALGQSQKFSGIGEMADRNSRAWLYTRQVVRDGWLTDRELEQMIREAA